MSESPFDQHATLSTQYLHEDFDPSTFSFYHDSSMDQYINIPEGSKVREALSPSVEGENSPKHKEDEQDVVMVSGPEPYTSYFSHSTAVNIPNPSETIDVDPHLSNSYPAYQPYMMPYQNFGIAHHYPSYHPYRHPHGMRRSPPTPMSPPLSASPQGSSGSRRHSGQFSSSSAVSPSIVSPMSALSTNLSLSDASPQGIPWNYSPLPPQYAGTPLSTVGTLANVSPTGPGLSMVSGFPYPVANSTVPSQRRVPKPRSSLRGPKAIKESVKKEDEDDSDFDIEATPRGGGLGFTVNSEERIPVPINKDEIRKARIESEQRRRDELREGFKRLKEALPVSNQRPSKSSLLDRSVAHIQQVEAANHYLLSQLEMMRVECEKLRTTNQELVHAVAVGTRAGGSGSPGSVGK